jgi:DNA modification methylase
MALKPYYEHAGITIYHGDCLEVLPQLGPVDLVFTSPPYLNQRSYGLDSFDWYAVVPPALASVSLTDTGQMLVNLGLKHDNGRVVRYWDALIDACETTGLRLFGWYVWDQGFGLPGDTGGRLHTEHEWIFHINRKRGKLTPTASCRQAGKIDWHSQGRRTMVRERSQGRANIGAIPAKKIRGSVLRLDRANPTTDNLTMHPAVFPLPLASEVLRCFPGLVLDPFTGSGTTLRAAKDLGRKAIGIEINERYCEIAAKRMAQEVLPLG